MVSPAVLRGPALALALWTAGCASTAATDVAGIADQEPLPYSVLLTGGAFVEDPAGGGELAGPTTETFGGPAPGTAGGLHEPLALPQLVRALQSGRVFARTVLDTGRDPVGRARLAAHRADLPLDDPEVRAVLAEARAAGHDFIVVVRRLVDGPIEDYGINDRWPLTVSLWFLVGLGMFIPDHTFESRATLQAAVFEVQTGRLVHRAVGAAGPIELSLVSRGDAFGLAQSILVPPFWVASDAASLADEVRLVTAQRLVSALARQLKSAACRQDLLERSRASIRLAEPRGGGGRGVRVRSAERLGAAALRIDGEALSDAEVERFTSRLLRSERPTPDGGFEYGADLPRPGTGRYVQVLVRTVAGEVASVTFDLEEQ
jgi:hypothetical protein